MSDPCAHHGTPFRRICFGSGSEGPVISDVWLNCPFEYEIDTRVEKGADHVTIRNIRRPGTTDYACPYDSLIFVFFETTRDGAASFSRETVGTSDERSYGLKVEPCDQQSCQRRITGTIGDGEVEIVLNFELRSDAYPTADYHQFFPDERPK